MVLKGSGWSGKCLWELCIGVERLWHHILLEMLQKQHIFFWLGHKICNWTHILSQKQFTHFLQKKIAHFVRKVFAHWNLPSEKFKPYGPLVRGRESDENNSERPVDALAEKHQWLTHWQTTWNQEMLAHLKVSKPKFIIFFWPASGDIAGWLGNKWIKRNYCGRRTDRRKSKRSLQT